jgi:hypothetical protein
VRRRRTQGAPCLCTSYGHGHDGDRCDQPVTGRTRGGGVKKVCDHCSHISRLIRSGELTPYADASSIPQPSLDSGGGRQSTTPPDLELTPEQPKTPEPMPQNPKPHRRYNRPGQRPGYRTDIRADAEGDPWDEQF